MQKLETDGMEELVLDLRGNGGGLLIEAVKIVNFFVPKNQVVVSTKGRVKTENHVYNTLADPVAPDMPLTVLIDEGSASASEIVAGSLQDVDRAVIVGETSFGKGLVQRTYDLKYGSKLKVTIAKYYTPSGRCVQRLEYYDKETGSKPKEIADSLLKTFKTKNGRVVKDGRGIEPDIRVELPELSKLSVQLITKDLVFNYATEYAYNNKSIAKAGEFKLSNEEYAAFKKYVSEQAFEYSTASEEQLKKTKISAEKEGYFKDIEAEYQAMLTKLTPSKERDLDKFQEEIRQMLENEIVSRYYFQNGRILDSFKNDPVLQEAKKILSDNTRYQKILGKP
jgi:carboxyl-terminal processing protease